MVSPCRVPHTCVYTDTVAYKAVALRGQSPRLAPPHAAPPLAVGEAVDLLDQEGLLVAKVLVGLLPVREQLRQTGEQLK